jgi:hypothetical protein
MVASLGFALKLRNIALTWTLVAQRVYSASRAVSVVSPTWLLPIRITLIDVEGEEVLDDAPAGSAVKARAPTTRTVRHQAVIFESLSFVI